MSPEFEKANAALTESIERYRRIVDAFGAESSELCAQIRERQATRKQNPAFFCMSGQHVKDLF